MEKQRLKQEDIVKLVTEFCKDHQVLMMDVVVGYGAAMVMHGLREDTSDVDLDINSGIFKMLVEGKGNVRIHGLLGACYDITEDISIHPVDIPGDAIVWIDGIPCHSLSMLRHMKRLMAEHPERRKEKVLQDLMDIDAIDHAMGR